MSPAANSLFTSSGDLAGRYCLRCGRQTPSRGPLPQRAREGELDLANARIIQFLARSELLGLLRGQLLCSARVYRRLDRRETQ